MSCSIREIQQITEIETFIEAHSLVLFDIDHTVLESADIYGHGNWFYDQIRIGKEQGVSSQETIRQIFPQWLESQRKNRVKPVEEPTPQFIARLQDRGVTVMALTARSREFIEISNRQLSSLNIDFRKTALPQIKASDCDQHPVTYHGGILFTSEGHSKAFALETYLNEIAHQPAHVILVDDSFYVLEELAELALKRGFVFTGLHYPLVDNRRDTWDIDEALRVFELRKNIQSDTR